jgi:hypothetical protein
MITEHQAKDGIIRVSKPYSVKISMITKSKLQKLTDRSFHEYFDAPMVKLFVDIDAKISSDYTV